MYIYLNDYRESRELNFFLIDVKIKQIKIIVEANSTVSILFYIFQLYFQHQSLPEFKQKEDIMFFKNLFHLDNLNFFMLLKKNNYYKSDFLPLYKNI